MLISKIDGKIKVENFSLDIEKKGEIICLLGPSGIGKTTILRSIAGLEKIESGSIKLKSNMLSSKIYMLSLRIEISLFLFKKMLYFHISQ